MTNTVASGEIVLARAMSFTRSTAAKKKNLSFCERRIHREALNILLEVTG
jgi:hypothetical protein